MSATVFFHPLFFPEQQDQLKYQSENAKKTGFETEQLAEQVKRLMELKAQNENELRTMSADINSEYPEIWTITHVFSLEKISIEKNNFERELETLKARRNALDDTIQRKM